MHNTFFTRRLLSAAAFIFVSAVCGYSCTADTPAPDKTIQRQFTMTDAVHAYNLDPQTASYASEAQILTALYEGLFSYNPSTLEPEYALAESYTLSDDKLTWTFTIREGAVFANGDPITAQTVRSSWLKLLSPETGAPYASLLDCIKGAEAYRTGKSKNETKVGITAEDDRTLEVRLEDPAEHLPKILCHHAFAVIHPENKATSGPCVIESRRENELLLKKNMLYWDRDSVALPSVKIVQSDDTEGTTYLYNIGKTNWVCAGIDYEKILSQDDILISPQFSTEYLFFNTAKAPWNNENVRSALLKAAPWTNLRSQYVISTEKYIKPLNRNPSENRKNEQDIEEAKKMLEKAGYGEKGKKAELVINIPDYENYRKQAAFLKEAWEQLGITVTVRTSDPDSYLDTIKKGDGDLFSYIWIGDFADPLAFLELFRSSSSLNDSGWGNRKFDALLKEAARIEDREKRYAKLAEAEQLLLDSGVIMPLSHTISVNIIDPEEIGGWYENALDIHPFKYMYFQAGKPIPYLVRRAD